MKKQIIISFEELPDKTSNITVNNTGLCLTESLGIIELAKTVLLYDKKIKEVEK